MNVEPRTGDLVLTYRGMVYPQHLDHMGHMNIQHYVAKFDQAARHLFDRIGMTSDYCRENDRGKAAVEMDLRYLKKLRAEDPVSVRSGLMSVDEKSLRLVHEMCLGEAGELAAVMRVLAVHLDRAAPLPEAIAARARALLIARPEA